MLFAIGAILLGLLLLIWSANRFVVGASEVAKSLKIAPLLIGMIIVGFGTSTPELFVSSIASLNGDSDMAIGNAIGSNIVNTCLILGITALVAPIIVSSGIVRRELPILLAISIVLGALIWDGSISRLDAAVLLVGFIGLVVWTIKTASKPNSDPLEVEFQQELSAKAMSFKVAVAWTVVGLIVLIISSRILVWGAVTVAEALGVSKLVISLTIVAFGTSFPELVTSLIAALKGEHDVAIGNVIGSNMFNLLAVVGVAGLLRPMESFTSTVLVRDWPTMLFCTAVLLVMTIGIRGRSTISRLEGGVLLCMYCAYTYVVLAL